MPVAVPNREEIQRRIADGSNVWIAAGDGDIERVRFLMEHDGAKPTSADNAKYTPLHAAASYGKIDMLRFLLKDEPADSVNVGDMDDETPLFFCEDLPAARVLIEEFHANSMLKNTEGLTASEKADVNEYPELAAYIRSHTGEQPTPRTELLARIGETDEAQPWEARQEEGDEEDDDDVSDASLDERVDGMVDAVDEIMRHAEETGTDPTERLREVVGAHVVHQILEGYNKQS